MGTLCLRIWQKEREGRFLPQQLKTENKYTWKLACFVTSVTSCTNQGIVLFFLSGGGIVFLVGGCLGSFLLVFWFSSWLSTCILNRLGCKVRARGLWGLFVYLFVLILNSAGISVKLALR